MRENTERPITVEMGTNTIAGTNPADIIKATLVALADSPGHSAPRVPILWDGHTADRILDALIGEVSTRSGSERVSTRQMTQD